jgi:hypothetical protein
MFRTFGCLAAFADTGGLGLFSGLLALGRRSAELAFFPDPGLPCATRRFRGATSARLVGFGGCTVAAGGEFNRFSAFDVIVLKSNVDDSAFPSGWHSAGGSCGEARRE